MYSSAEQKAIAGACILAEHLGLTPLVVEELGEVDRSATGYLPTEEHAAVADAFFAEPDHSARGWETDTGHGNIALVSHGVVAALYLCHLKGLPIAKVVVQDWQFIDDCM